MVSPSRKNNQYGENSSAGVTSIVPPCYTTGIFPFLDGNGVSIGRFIGRCRAHRGSNDSECNYEWVLESKWKTAFENTLPKCKEKHTKKGENADMNANYLKNVDIDTTLRLSLPGVERKNEPYNKNLVSSKSPTQISLASPGPNPDDPKCPICHKNLAVDTTLSLSLPKICMGCISCDIHFAADPMADPKCPRCRKNGFSLDDFLNYRKNQMARGK